MGASLKDRALRSAEVVRQPAIREALAAEDTRAAVTEALAWLRRELAGVRRHRPADGALIDAQLAGSISAIAAGLHALRPDRPAGCPRVPRAADLLAVYDAAREGDGDA